MTIVSKIDYNPQKHYLGHLCKKEHDYKGTGQSLRFLSNDQCWHCNSSKNASNISVWYIKQNFATLDRFLEIVSVLGDEELNTIGRHKIAEAFKFFEQN